MIKGFGRGLLSILGAGAILGSSLIYSGCGKGEDSDKVEKVNSSDIVEKDSDSVQRYLIADNKGPVVYANCDYFGIGTNDLDGLASFRLLFSKEQSSIGSRNFEKLEDKLSLSILINNEFIGDIDSDSSGCYVVFSEPVEGFSNLVSKSADNSLITDKKTKDRIFTILSGERYLRSKFNPKKSEIYFVGGYGDKTTCVHRDKCDDSSFPGFSRERGFFAKFEYLSPKVSSQEGLIISLVGDFRINKESDLKEFIGCASYMELHPFFSDALGSWDLKKESMRFFIDPYKVSVITYSGGHLSINYPKYDSSSDMISLFPYDGKFPALSRKKIGEEVVLYFHHSDGKRDLLVKE